MGTTKQPTATPWLPLADENSQFCLAQTGRGTLTRITGDHAGDRIVGITETDFEHARVCVNLLAPFTTEQIKAGIDLADLVKQRDQLQQQLEAERASLFAENQRKQQLEQQCAQLLAERDRAERALRAAGWTYTEGAEEWRPPLGPSASPLLDKIDQLQAEREACAAICDRYATALDHGGNEYTRSRECQQAAAAIRARQEAQQ